MSLVFDDKIVVLGEGYVVVIIVSGYDVIKHIHVGFYVCYQVFWCSNVYQIVGFVVWQKCCCVFGAFDYERNCFIYVQVIN